MIPFLAALLRFCADCCSVPGDALQEAGAWLDGVAERMEGR